MNRTVTKSISITPSGDPKWARQGTITGWGLRVTVLSTTRNLRPWIIKGAMSRFRDGTFERGKAYELDDTGEGGLGFFRFECRNA